MHITYLGTLMLRFAVQFRAINSVGLECYLDRVEVTGSSPVWPTKGNS